MSHEKAAKQLVSHLKNAINIHYSHKLFIGTTKNLLTKYKSAYMRSIHDDAPEDANFVLGACVAVKKKDFISWPSETRFAEDSFWAHEYVFHYKKRIFFDRETMVDHYKEYSFQSWIKNDFLRPCIEDRHRVKVAYTHLLHPSTIKVR